MLNIFRSDSAPYALVLLVAVLGWLLNSFWTELTASRVISYSLHSAPPGATSTLHIRNISRLKTIKDFTFSLVCNGDLCFNKMSGSYSSPTYHSPLYSQNAEETQTAFEIGYKVTLVAGGHLQIDFQRNADAGDIRFFYRPQSNSEELYVFKENVATKVMRHAVDIYFSAMAGAIVLFLVVMLVSLPPRRKEVSDEKTKELVVGIYRHRDGQSASTGREGNNPSRREGQQPPSADPKPREDHGGKGGDEGAAN